MKFALKAADKILKLIGSFAEGVQERLNRQGCVIQEGAKLHPSCKIYNLQSRQSAIEIAAHTHVRGELLVYAHGGDIRIGESCFVGENSRIWSASSIHIGDRVLISHSVNIHDNDSHSVSAARRFQHFQQITSTGHPDALDDVDSAPIVIGDDAWIGFNSAILKGVTVGQGAIISAGSVVIRDVPSFSIVAGNPAQIIGQSRP